MADVLIALGGNVGDVRATFRKAISNICGMTQATLLARSSDYSTPPWGNEAQPPFVIACIDGFDYFISFLEHHRLEALVSLLAIPRAPARGSQTRDQVNKLSKLFTWDR